MQVVPPESCSRKAWCLEVLSVNHALDLCYNHVQVPNFDDTATDPQRSHGKRKFRGLRRDGSVLFGSYREQGARWAWPPSAPPSRRQAGSVSEQISCNRVVRFSVRARSE